LPTYAYIHDMEFTFINGFKYLFIATAGRGVWYSRAIDLGNKLSTSTSNNDVLIRINPNPVFDQMTISIDDAEADLINIQVLDLSGKVLIKKQIEVSGFNAVLDCAALVKGCYVIQISYANKMFSKKFIRL